MRYSRTTQAAAMNESSTGYLICWRGKQEGPYPLSVIERKLAANEIGLLHQIINNGQWMTIRDFLAEKEALLRAQKQAQEEQSRREREELAQQERRQREELEQQAREHEDQLREANLAEERRKNDLLAAALDRQKVQARPHRGGLIFALALLGLIVFGPLCVAAWVMGSSDLREMDMGTMDPSGRSATSSGRSIGIFGTLLWGIAVVFLFISGV